jgi:large subunit ribosomal protein L25
MATPQTIELAKTLPPRLLRFFQRYPPPQLFPTITSQIAAATPADSPVTISTTPPANPNTTVTETSSLDAIAIPTTPIAPEDVEFPNPFQPTKNFTTGRWHGPVYGLRKQADLVKLANAHGVVDLLPWTIKKPGEKEARRIERGLTVKGTGEGQRVKGKLWERTLKGRLEMRRQAMLDMPRLIQEWKQVCFVCAGWVRMSTDGGAERSRSWVEEVAQWQGEEVEGLRRAGLEQWVLWGFVYLCVWVGEHIGTAFGQVHFLLCIILAWRDAGVEERHRELCNIIYPLIIYKCL